MSADDLILAFFPCTYFECQSQLWFFGNNYSQSKWDMRKKLESDIERHNELNSFYVLLSKLTIICIDRGLRLVIENPYNQPHYLTMYWCLKPAIIDMDRTENGDYYKKPTQYYFIGMKPKDNLVFEALDYVPMRQIGKLKRGDGLDVKKQRSEIHPQYANRFIRQYLIDMEGK